MVNTLLSLPLLLERIHLRVTIEELVVDREGIFVLWVVEEHGVQAWSTSLVLLIDSSVNVVEQLVTDADAISSSRRSYRPAVKFLVDGVDVGMVSHEGRKASKSRPSVNGG